MASTWATSWGTSWGTSWDGVSVPTPPEPAVVVAGGGGGEMRWRGVRTKRRRNRTEELYDAIEHTIRETLHPALPVARQDHVPLPAKPVDHTHALAELSQVAQGHRQLQQRLAQLRHELAAAQQSQGLAQRGAMEEDDDEAFLLLS